MANFINVRTPTTNWAAGIPAFTFDEIEAAAFDANIFAAINGTGGTWAPVDPLIIGGSGAHITGPTFVWGNAGILETNGTSRFKLNGSDWPLLGISASLASIFAADGVTNVPARSHAGNKRTLITPCGIGQACPWWSSRFRLDVDAIQLSAQSFENADDSITTPIIYVPLRTHDSARMVSATLTLTPSASSPGSSPRSAQIRIVAVDQNGTSLPLTLQAPNADVNGWVKISTIDRAAGSQEFTVPIDTNPASPIVIATFAYRAEIMDESGQIEAPYRLVVKTPVVAATTGNITLSGAQTIDGQTLSSTMHDRCLVWKQTNVAENGIWLVNSGTWTRAADAMTNDDFPLNAVVPVLFGDVHGSTAWQVTSVTPSNVTPATWQALHAQNIGDLVVPTASHLTGLYYVATAGTTSGTEPVWPTTIGAAVTDGSMAWLAVGYTGVPTVQFIDEATPLPLAVGFAPMSFVGNLFHSVAIDFDSIVDQRFQ